MKIIASICLIMAYSIVVYAIGLQNGKKTARIEIKEKEVIVYREREKNTLEHEKTAKKIKCEMKRFKSNVEECNFVLDYPIADCLQK